MKKKIGLIIAAVIVVLGIVAWVAVPPMMEHNKETQTEKQYSSLNIKEPANMTKKWLSEGKKDSKFMLIVYKRTCKTCRENFDNIKTLTDKAKKNGYTVVIVEAPQKNIIDAYPVWTKNFQIDNTGTPVAIVYSKSFYTTVAGNQQYLPIGQATISGKNQLNVAEKTLLK